MSNTPNNPSVISCPDVYLQGALLPRLTALHAARTALRLYYDHESLPFANMGREYPGGGGIVTIGIWDAAKYNPEGTIFGHPNECKRSTSFLRAAHKLIAFANTSEPPNYLHIMLMANDDHIPPHQDIGNYGRAFIQLLGHRIMSFEQSVQDVLIDFGMSIGPGDAYAMRFRNDKTSIMHGVDYLHEPGGEGCLALYVNTKPTD